MRQRAAQLFADGRSATEVAGLPEASTKSAYQWRRAWVAGGAEALTSKGPSGPPEAVGRAAGSAEGPA
uniref:helix-turn-helix domain-containing protein n=1 Tax=Paractinoplanes polyasparticus TaxID=2856853 RepID=UPI0027DF3013|nr:helix-turn-helix domain-containing protein [Actinoplanes polyasparticus]